MDIVAQLKQSLGEPNKLHHAHFIVGDRKRTKEALHLYIESVFSFSVVGNPDVLSFSFDVMGVDESRALTSVSSITSISGHRFIIVEANFLTREAQNALLKSLEEPLFGTFFFFLIPQQDTLLPTIRSRVVVHSVAGAIDENDIQKRAEMFLKAPIAKRMKMIKEFSAEISDDEKSKADVIVFLAELERLLHSNRSILDHGSLFADIAMAKKYLTDRSPSVKMILEHIALSLQ